MIHACVKGNTREEIACPLLARDEFSRPEVCLSSTSLCLFIAFLSPFFLNFSINSQKFSSFYCSFYSEGFASSGIRAFSSLRRGKKLGTGASFSVLTRSQVRGFDYSSLKDTTAALNVTPTLCSFLKGGLLCLSGGPLIPYLQAFATPRNYDFRFFGLRALSAITGHGPSWNCCSVIDFLFYPPRYVRVIHCEGETRKRRAETRKYILFSNF